MNALTRWEQYSPVSIGLENFFSRLDTFADSTAANYPPYNIVKVDENTQELQVALAGFEQKDVEVAVERGVLSLRAAKENDESLNYVHRGLAFRNVARNWQLSDNAVVNEVTFVNGLLKIKIGLEIPEDQQRKVFDIAAAK
jgi:molecular chaperone IbpA